MSIVTLSTLIILPFLIAGMAVLGNMVLDLAQGSVSVFKGARPQLARARPIATHWPAGTSHGLRRARRAPVG